MQFYAIETMYIATKEVISTIPPPTTMYLSRFLMRLESLSWVWVLRTTFTLGEILKQSFLPVHHVAVSHGCVHVARDGHEHIEHANVLVLDCKVQEVDTQG